MFLVEHPQHLFFIDLEQSAGGNGRGTYHAGQLRCCETLFSAKITCPKQSQGSLFAVPGNHNEPDAPTLDIKHTVARIALAEGCLFVVKGNDFSAHASFR
jgi:hypothetical protein